MQNNECFFDTFFAGGLCVYIIPAVYSSRDKFLIFCENPKISHLYNSDERSRKFFGKVVGHS